MDTAVILLAVAGFAAALLRVIGALLVALYRGADAFLTRDTLDVRARRGDITGLAEAGTALERARRRRLQATARVFMWGGLLIVPALTPWPATIYAAYSLLWLVPRRPRPTRSSP